MSRTNKSAINSIIGISFNLLSSLTSFALQALFVRLLGLEYSGINSLFTQILSVLNLAELGFNNAILFRLYHSISEQDDDRTELLLCTYKRICMFVALFVLCAGLCCVPFLDQLISEDTSFPESLWSIFIIILLTSSVTQYLNHKSIFLVAKQERYSVTIVDYTCTFICHLLQIITLVLFQNIYIYLLCKLFTSILSGIILGHITHKRFGIKWKTSTKLDKVEKGEIAKDVGALSIYKFCRTIDSSIDTFLISKLIAVTTTAVYGSAMLVVNSVQDLLCQFNDGMIASIGDLNVSSEKKRIYDVFFQTFHFTYLIFGVSAVVLSVLLKPFMQWWIGYCLTDVAGYLILANFVIYGFGMNVATFRNSMGLFKKGWLRPAITAALNLMFSISLTLRFGIIGTLLGTTLSRGLTLSWYDPYIVIKYGMGGRARKYYLRYVQYMASIFLSAICLLKISNFLPVADTFIKLLWHGVLYLICASVLILLFGALVPEQKNVLDRIKPILMNLFGKRFSKER